MKLSDSFKAGVEAGQSTPSKAAHSAAKAAGVVAGVVKAPQAVETVKRNRDGIAQAAYLLIFFGLIAATAFVFHMERLEKNQQAWMKDLRPYIVKNVERRRGPF